MEESPVVVEKPEMLMVSSLNNNSNPSLRTAHFLIPNHSSNPKCPLLFSSSLPSFYRPEKCHLNVTFKGWRNPTHQWKSWVLHMEGIYGSVWKKAGIYDSIMSSICSIRKNDDLIISLAEKWCPETNSFVLPWGEATVTLEDVMILGGFSVLGSPGFSCPLESKELEEIEKKLKEARILLGRSPAKKATQTGWMKMFMFSGSDIEHEAFLSFWLERFVFHDSEHILKARIFPLAIRLAKGEIVALAPAVLATIYRDLGLLKATILSAAEFQNDEDYTDVLAITLWSPMDLVQLWAWERFPEFQPKPNFIKNGDPRSALWDNVSGKEVKNLRLTLDSAENTFYWRPYAAGLQSSNLPNYYKEKEEWRELESSQNLQSLVLCLRASELVGLGCVEQYLPHRVARQFGLDQDIPGEIARSNEFPELAWINYIRPFSNTKLFVPSKFFQPGITIQYLVWWKQAALDSCDMFKGTISAPVRRKRNSRKRSRWVSQARIAKMGDHRADVHSSPCLNGMKNIDAPCEEEDVKPAIKEMLRSSDAKKSVVNKASGDYRADVHSSPYLNCHLKNIDAPCEEDIKPAINEMLKSSHVKKSVVNKAYGDCRADIHSSPYLNCHLKNIDAPCEEDIKPAINEMLKSSYVKRSDVNKASGDSMSLAGQNQGISSGALKDMKSQEKGMEKGVPVNTSTGRPSSPLEEKPDVGAEIPTCSTHKRSSRVGEESNENAVEIPGLMALEARIAMLESAFAEVKAERFGSRFGKKCC